MPLKQVVQIPLDTQTGIIMAPSVSSGHSRFFGYATVIEKENRDINIESRTWTRKVFHIGGIVIAAFGWLLRWFNGIGRGEIDLHRMEHRSDRQLGIRKWNL
jgi:hypothetical protein